MSEEGTTVSKLSDILKISNQKIYSYISSATPNNYVYNKFDGIYSFTSDEVKLLCRINDYSKTNTYRQIKRKLTFEMEKAGTIKHRDKRESIIIPEFVANCIDEEVEKGTDIFRFIEKRLYIFHLGMIEYFESDYLRKEEVKYRKELFMNAWINGYDGIEVETYYVVKSTERESFCLGKGFDKEVKLITDFKTNKLYRSYPYSALAALTEKEIKDFDEGFWEMAVSSRR